MGLLNWLKKSSKGNLSEEIRLHVAGATVLHKSPFENLKSYNNDVEITQSFREEWVIPFYFELNNKSDKWIEKMIQLTPKIGVDVILKNLGDFDWRTRSVGAYFASIKNEKRFTDIIGTHLLKSEVCFAGSQYAITLAAFNTKEAIEYLNRYLDYYLKRIDLDFDQTQVISAIKYLDEHNGTNLFDQHSYKWSLFCEAKIESLKRSMKDFKNQNAEGMHQAFEGHMKFWRGGISSKPVADMIRVINRIKKQ